MANGHATVRPYLSPTLVLLALDWPDGRLRPSFLGFAIRRAPGFSKGEKQGYLFNKIGFMPLGPDSHPMPSNVAPIQKFLWWDSAINTEDRGKSFAYTVVPVLGTGPNDLQLQEQSAQTVTVSIPRIVTDGIGTYFNRAVVSSQAFSREFPAATMDIDKAMAWLANGLEGAIPGFLKGADAIEGAVYHLTDNEWVLPALKKMSAKGSLVYAFKPPSETVNAAAVTALKKTGIHFDPRSKTAIMHDKFLVKRAGGQPVGVLTGSANFTPEGLTSQANLLHTFASPRLAALYAKRRDLIAPDPAVAATAKDAGWSAPVKIGKASVRVFFSPEPSAKRVSLDTVVAAVKAAKQSAVFCMFSPTDKPLLDALIAVGDKKKVLFGMLNSITDPSKKKKKTGPEAGSGEPPKQPSAAAQVQVTIFNRSRKDKKVLAYSYFNPGNTPAGFLPELSSVDFSSRSIVPPLKPAPGKKKAFVPAVHIHHKFLVLDAETKNPVIYTGSANFSKNSTNRNDENLLEIKGDRGLAQTYLAEFMRLYEHYRARALYNIAHPKGKPAPGKKGEAFVLKRTRDEWVKGAYTPGTKEYLARVNFAT